MELNFSYELIRTKRKSVAIHIQGGKVVVRAPLKTDLKRIEDFLISKQGWIDKKLTDYSNRSARFADVFDCKRFSCLGQDLEIVVSDKRSVRISGNRIFIPNIYFNNGQICKSDELEKALRNAYRRFAKSFLEGRINELSATTNLKYTSFALTNATTKWGSCDSHNRIRLSWRLSLLDIGLIDYVIVHELAHTVEHNHSKKFWKLVYSIYPQYLEKKRCLKDVGILIKIW